MGLELSQIWRQWQGRQQDCRKIYKISYKILLRLEWQLSKTFVPFYFNALLKALLFTHLTVPPQRTEFTGIRRIRARATNLYYSTVAR